LLICGLFLFWFLGIVDFFLATPIVMQLLEFIDFSNHSVSKFAYLIDNFCELVIDLVLDFSDAFYFLLKPFLKEFNCDFLALLMVNIALTVFVNASKRIFMKTFAICA
jgi:hypothetical protein